MNLKYYTNDFISIKLFIKRIGILGLFGIISTLLFIGVDETLNFMSSIVFLFVFVIVFLVILCFFMNIRDNNIKNNGEKIRCKIVEVGTFYHKLSFHGYIEFKRGKETFKILGIYPNKDFLNFVDKFKEKKDYYIDIYDLNTTLYGDLKSIETSEK